MQEEHKMWDRAYSLVLFYSSGILRIAMFATVVWDIFEDFYSVTIDVKFSPAVHLVMTGPRIDYTALFQHNA